MEKDIPLLRKVFETIEDGAGSLGTWDQTVWGYDNNTARGGTPTELDHPELGVVVVEPNCGTSMCFAGWTVILGHPGSALLCHRDNGLANECVLKDGTVVDIGDEAARLLGLDQEKDEEWDSSEAEVLFDSDNCLATIRGVLERWGVFD
jgi:hypothetical protein